MTASNPKLRDKLASEARHAEETRDAALPYRRRRSARSSVCGLRLPDERIDQLRRLAEARGVEPSALVGQWVTDQLDAAAKNRDPGTERWERDFRTTVPAPAARRTSVGGGKLTAPCRVRQRQRIQPETAMDAERQQGSSTRRKRPARPPSWEASRSLYGRRCDRTSKRSR
jgi:hypothetical protein